MPDITIYGPPQSSFTRTVRMLCEEKGAPYELQSVELNSPAHLAMHPFGKVPVCECDGEVVYETLAICSYLNDILAGPSFVPQDLRERAHMHRWMSMIIHYGHPIMVRQVIQPRFGVVEIDESVINDAVVESVRQLGIADDELGDRQYLAGRSLSVADFLLASIVDHLLVFEDMQEKTGDCANLRRWFEELSARDSFTATAPVRPV